MLFLEATRWYLIPTPLVFGKRAEVLRKDPESFYPVLVVKMVPQTVPGSQGTQAAKKRAWALRSDLRGTDVKYLRNVFRLTDRQPVPVNFRIRPMHTLSVRRHQTRGKLNSSVRSGDPSSQLLTVRHPPYHATP